MGLMDKLKAQAEQVVTKAQEGTAQAQAKFDNMQAKRASEGLLRDLGAAYYAEKRSSGPHDAVEKALGALDDYSSRVGPVDVSTTGPRPTPTQTAPTQSGPTQSGPTQSGPTQSGPTRSGPAAGAQPSGDFTLDDI